jgi:hypothetical protein
MSGIIAGCLSKGQSSRGCLQAIDLSLEKRTPGRRNLPLSIGHVMLTPLKIREAGGDALHIPALEPGIGWYLLETFSHEL